MDFVTLMSFCVRVNIHLNLCIKAFFFLIHVYPSQSCYLWNLTHRKTNALKQWMIREGKLISTAWFIIPSWVVRYNIPRSWAGNKCSDISLLAFFISGVGTESSYSLIYIFLSMNWTTRQWNSYSGIDFQQQKQGHLTILAECFTFSFHN